MTQEEDGAIEHRRHFHLPARIDLQRIVVRSQRLCRVRRLHVGAQPQEPFDDRIDVFGAQEGRTIVDRESHGNGVRFVHHFHRHWVIHEQTLLVGAVVAWADGAVSGS